MPCLFLLYFFGGRGDGQPKELTPTVVRDGVVMDSRGRLSLQGDERVEKGCGWWMLAKRAKFSHYFNKNNPFAIDKCKKIS